MFEVQVIPARVSGGEGRYALDGINITGFEVADATIDVTAAKCRFTFESFPEASSKGRGRLVRTNLIRQRAGWSWADLVSDCNPSYACQELTGIRTLVSLEYGNVHSYAISVHLQRLCLQHYPNSATEPRLRPTCRAREIVYGDTVGTIRMRGREHPVYETIRVLAA